MILTAIVAPDGLHPTRYTATSFAQAADFEPEGVYTITRTFETNKALLLDAHLDRLEESAALENIPLKLDRARLRAALRQLIANSGHTDSRFRITVPRQTPDTLYLALEPLAPIPVAVRQQGVAVATLDVQRHNPIAKTTAWMTERAHAMQNLEHDIYEAILVSHQGELLEGTSSNFYAVLNGELWTADEGILNGISRKALLQVVAGVCPLRLNAPTLADIPRFSEAFLTSSSRGVIPIVRIDALTVGDGQVGHITKTLSQRYDAWTASHLQPI